MNYLQGKSVADSAQMLKNLWDPSASQLAHQSQQLVNMQSQPLG